MTWASISPQDRGTIRERIYRYLAAYGASSSTAVLHGTSLPIDTIRAALDELIRSGAVRSDASTPTLYSAVNRA